MHDTRLEDQLRSALRWDGDSLPLTITADELERRLALRRRDRAGRRIGLLAAGVAAVAVGSVFALSTGLFAPPNVAVGPSPELSLSPTASPLGSLVGGLTPIEGHPDGITIDGVTPTFSARGQPHRFTIPGSRTTAGRMWIDCRGTGSIRIQLPAEAIDAPCDGRLEPDAFDMPISDSAQEIVVAVGASLAYTILVETIPLPTELPALDALTEPAQVEGRSANAMPDWDAPDVLVTTTVGTIQPGPIAEVKFACLGPGTIEIALREPGAQLTDPAISSMTIQCHGQPDGMTSSVGDQGPLDVVVTTGAAMAWRLSAAGLAAAP
jgi:hypothetical protein